MPWNGYKATLWVGAAYVFARAATSAIEAAVPGHVEGWGNNTFGQASPLPGLDGVIAVAAGGDHSLALRTDGTVAAWGANFSGATDVPIGLNTVADIDAASHSVALKKDGTVVVWGHNLAEVTSVPPGLDSVKAIAAGNIAGNPYTLALQSNGTVVAWGINSCTNLPPGLNGITGIAAGNSHALALRNDGTVVGWGANSQGEATPPPGLSGVVAVRAGQSSSLAIKADGTVAMWGSFAPAPPGLAGVVDAQFGANHVIALRSDGVVVAWGDNFHGQGQVPTGGNGITAIAAGGSHNLVVTARPLILALTPPVTANAGSTVEFFVDAAGAPLTYQWRRNGANLSNQTGSSLILVNVQAGDSGTYDVLVTNPFGTVQSSPTSLSFPPPQITAQPQSLTLYRGETALFNVAATGLAPLAYQWLKDGAILPGQTAATLTLTAIGSNHAGSYLARVTDAVGSATSSLAATLSIYDPTDPTPLVFAPIRDTSIYSSGFKPLGESTILAGTRNNGIRDRGLLRFDLSSLSPASVIVSAQLHLTVTRIPSAPPQSAFHLHRLLKPWGQDATWANATAGIPWAAPGGQGGIDYSATTSAASIATSAACDFGSTAQMLADVQGWVENPGANHGWMLKTQNELLLRSARHFGSSESTQRPRLSLRVRDSVRLANARTQDGNFAFDFDAANGWFHRVQSSGSPESADWTTFTNIPAGPARTIGISVPFTPSRRFYRVLLE